MAAWIVLAVWICADSSPDLETPPAVHLRIDQDGRLSALQLRIVVEQIEKIWRVGDVRVTWGRYADPAPSGRAIVSMRVVSVESRHRGDVVLGWVPGDVHEQTTPTLFISLSSMRDLVAPFLFRGVSFNRQPVVLRDRLIAQAIGRVAAHELGHAFMRGKQHHERGLMRHTYSIADLMAPSLKPFQIPTTERAALRREVARLTEMQTQWRTVNRRELGVSYVCNRNGYLNQVRQR